MLAAPVCLAVLVLLSETEATDIHVMYSGEIYLMLNIKHICRGFSDPYL